MTITCIARRVGHGFTFAVAKMFSHFDFQCALYQHLGQLFEQAVFTNQVFRFLVVGQQAIGQFE